MSTSYIENRKSESVATIGSRTHGDNFSSEQSDTGFTCSKRLRSTKSRYSDEGSTEVKEDVQRLEGESLPGYPLWVETR